METLSFLRNPKTLVICAAVVGLSTACGEPDANAVGGAARGNAAALSAECTDPTLIVESQTIGLWPPNHKFHEVLVGDCVSAIDSCGGELQGEFIWGSSDEPIDANGDGHHAPDIGLGVDTGHACVRSERQGPRDGRVYKLGVRIVDGSGDEVERECTIIVDHDQRGVVGVDSGEAYRVTFDAAHAGLDCEGNPAEPPSGASGEGGAGAVGGAGGIGGAPDEAGVGGASGEGGGVGGIGGAPDEAGVGGASGEGGVGGVGGAPDEAGQGGTSGEGGGVGGVGGAPDDAGEGGTSGAGGGVGGTGGASGDAGEGGAAGELPPIDGPI